MEIDKFIPAIILLISPNVLVLISLRSYSTNPTLQQSRTYIFAEDCIIVKGLGFESTFKWEYIIKLKETKTFLLLFSSKKSAQFIEKNKLTKPELDFIKSKVVKK